MASKLLDFQVDANDIKRVHAKLARASGKSLYTRMQRANLAAGDLLARRVAAAAPRRTGNLRRSVKARPERRRGIGARGNSTTVLVGPTGRRGSHRHLVILGTGIRPGVSSRSSNPWRVLPGRAGAGETTRRGSRGLAGVNVRRAGFTVGRMTPNPFVDRAAAGFGKKAAALVAKEWRAALR